MSGLNIFGNFFKNSKDVPKSSEEEKLEEKKLLREETHRKKLAEKMRKEQEERDAKEARDIIFDQEEFERLKNDYQNFQESTIRYEKQIDELLEQRNAFSEEFWQDHLVNRENGKLLFEQIKDLNEQIRKTDSELYSLVLVDEVIDRVQTSIKREVFSKDFLKDFRKNGLFFRSRDVGVFPPGASKLIDSIIGEPVCIDLTISRNLFLKAKNHELIARMFEKTGEWKWMDLSVVYNVF